METVDDGDRGGGLQHAAGQVGGSESADQPGQSRSSARGPPPGQQTARRTVSVVVQGFGVLRGGGSGHRQQRHHGEQDAGSGQQQHAAQQRADEDGALVDPGLRGLRTVNLVCPATAGFGAEGLHRDEGDLRQQTRHRPEGQDHDRCPGSRLAALAR